LLADAREAQQVVSMEIALVEMLEAYELVDELAVWLDISMAAK
jgi:hypothetical protein